jgi:putative hemolysin
MMSRLLTSRRLVACLTAALVAAACATPAGSSQSRAVGSSPQASPGSFDEASAERYCTDQGGMLVDRQATWNTNADPSAQLQMAGRMRFCEFQSGQGDQTTRISVDLVTLYSEKPTLAGVAYLSKVPPTLPKQPSANPAIYNCQEGLGGAASFGNSVAGGGWVDASQPVFVEMDMCTFEDMSAIDAFGILYYATGTVRGADLATKMRYRPNGKLPAIFTH